MSKTVLLSVIFWFNVFLFYVSGTSYEKYSFQTFFNNFLFFNSLRQGKYCKIKILFDHVLDIY